MNLRQIFRWRQPITTVPALTDFVDANAAFLVQKGLYEYARARAGHYAKVLFAEKGFQDAIERSRWSAFPLGLAMVTEMVEGALRPYVEDRRTSLDKLIEISMSVFNRYPTPAALEPERWSELRDDLARRLDLIGIHAIKPAKDIPIPFAESYFALMPIHDKLRASEFPTIKNYLRVSMCNIHDDFTGRVDAPALASALQAS